MDVWHKQCVIGRDDVCVTETMCVAETETTTPEQRPHGLKQKPYGHHIQFHKTTRTPNENHAATIPNFTNPHARQTKTTRLFPHPWAVVPTASNGGNDPHNKPLPSMCVDTRIQRTLKQARQLALKRSLPTVPAPRSKIWRNTEQI